MGQYTLHPFDSGTVETKQNDLDDKGNFKGFIHNKGEDKENTKMGDLINMRKQVYCRAFNFFSKQQSKYNKAN